MKRVGVFFFYDVDGIVDDYVTHFLRETRPFFTHILTVCNGKLTKEGRDKLEVISDKVLVRENKGFDSWAYKEGMEHLGKEFIAEHDELILFNFTNFGPFYPLSEMFDEMDKDNVDFWGMTTYHHNPYDPFRRISYGCIPEHLQSHWIAIRKKMFASPEFSSYWKKLPPINDYADAVAFHEAIFTKHFNDKGFTSRSYIDTEDLKDIYEYPLLYLPLDMLKRRCPILKRRMFSSDYGKKGLLYTGKETLDAFEYIRKNLTYDTGLIFQNLLRTSHQEDLHHNLYWDYVLPSSRTLAGGSADQRKVALIFHSYFNDLFETCFEYIKSMPIGSDIYITTDTEAKKESIIEKIKDFKDYNIEIVLIENRGRDVSALLVPFQTIVYKYDYICFIHDKKTAYIKPQIIGRDFFERCIDNLLYSKEYVLNLIDTFDQNPCMGLLMPPVPNFVVGYEWGNNFEKTKELADRLKLDVPMAPNKMPIAPLGTMFWFRPEALQTLFDYGWEYKDFPAEPNKNDGTLLHAIERIYSFVVQHEGFYSAYVMSDYFARTELVNRGHMLSQVVEVLKSRFTKAHGFYPLLNTLKGNLTHTKGSSRFLKKEYWRKKFKKILKGKKS